MCIVSFPQCSLNMEKVIDFSTNLRLCAPLTNKPDQLQSPEHLLRNQ